MKPLTKAEASELRWIVDSGGRVPTASLRKWFVLEADPMLICSFTDDWVEITRTGRALLEEYDAGFEREPTTFSAEVAAMAAEGIQESQRQVHGGSEGGSVALKVERDRAHALLFQISDNSDWWWNQGVCSHCGGTEGAKTHDVVHRPRCIVTEVYEWRKKHNRRGPGR